MAQEFHALYGVGLRAATGLGFAGEGDVLLQHVPAPIPVRFQLSNHPGDVNGAKAKWNEHPVDHRLAKWNLARPHPGGRFGIDVLEVDVEDPAHRPLGDLDRVATS